MKRIIAFALLLAFTALPQFSTAQVERGNVIVSINEFTGSVTAPTYIAEYDTSGTRIQTLADVPEPGGVAPTTDQARDLTSINRNLINVYNGTFDPYLAELDVAGSTWTQQTYADWSTANNISYGGLERYKRYVYATDMDTAGDEPMGVVRFDLISGSTIRFGTDDTDPIDLNIDRSGTVYTLNSNSDVEYFDSDGNYQGVLTLAGLSWRAIDVYNNRIFAASWGGDITEFDMTGTAVNTINVSGANFSDLDINEETGQIVLGTGFDGEIVFTDLSLASTTSHVVYLDPSAIGGDVFVAWAIPEPSSTAIVLSLILWQGIRRKRAI